MIIYYKADTFIVLDFTVDSLEMSKVLFFALQILCMNIFIGIVASEYVCKIHCTQGSYAVSFTAKTPTTHVPSRSVCLNLVLS